MIEWIPDYGNVQRIDIMRVTLEARSGVRWALLDLYLRDGTVVRPYVPMFGIAYGTLIDTVAVFNRSRQGRR